ncbi:AraC-like DNA-binding protein [Pseudonocardia eucalypti]|uniref:helix-turn-helix domain-containing protein n=1 Tax=Pseudonocardia eucalypti TaxID=648755 RepID=UPI00161A4B50|nr:AraC-like DNA-binding protein [Pseudonocardia eucalypti]
MAVPLRPHAARGPSLTSSYRTYPASPPLRPFARLGWTGDPGWPRSLRLLPDGCVDLVARDGRMVAVLPTPGVRRVELRATDRPVGLRLRCGTAGTLLGHDLSRLPAGGELDLTELCGGVLRELPSIGPDTVLAALARARLAEGALPDPAVLRAVRLLRAPRARVDAVAAELGLSPRTLHRRVAAQVGYGPKQLQRVFRFQRFLTALPRLAERRGSAALAELAAELGYADQSHLGRDCRELTGTSPARLLAGWSGH